jgi:hypothetical protein
MTQPLIFTADPSKTYQMIEHFGASDAWSADPVGKWWSEANKNILADFLFSMDNGIGLSAWRFNIGGGMGLIGRPSTATFTPASQSASQAADQPALAAIPAEFVGDQRYRDRLFGQVGEYFEQLTSLLTVC